MNNIIYTDSCPNEECEKIKEALGIEVIRMASDEDWDINMAMNLITIPNIELAVINIINEKTIIEMGLLSFMCKKLLVTTREITKYHILFKKVVDYYNTSSDIRNNSDKFIDWYRRMFW